MTDTVTVPREVIERAVEMAKAIMKAEPLYGCVVYHGDEQISGQVEEASDLACLVLDEMAEPAPAPNARADAPKAEPVRWTEDMERESRWGDYERGFRDGQLSQPEAPKLEQEPVAWEATFEPTGQAVTLYRDPTGMEGWIDVTPLYTHPAPKAEPGSGDHAELAKLAEAATHKSWAAFTDDSGARPHTNLVSFVPVTDCALSIPGAHKNDPNVAFIAAANPTTVLALLAENAELDATAADLQHKHDVAVSRLAEAERKLTEAVRIFQQIETHHGIECIPDNEIQAEIRTFLQNQEAERG